MQGFLIWNPKYCSQPLFLTVTAMNESVRERRENPQVTGARAPKRRHSRQKTPTKT
jgi:hypothetical protein